MNITVVGGGLQGLEITYLAQKAGWQVTLLDRNPAPPASALCDHFIHLNIGEEAAAKDIFEQTDVIFAALENQAGLKALVDLARQADRPLVFDPAAFGVTRCKAASNRLFRRLGLSLPADGDQCDGPVIVKPTTASGSRRVRLFSSHQAAKDDLVGASAEKNWICQQYLTGPSYSVEVIGVPGHYLTFAVTDLYMDDRFDCKRVTAPTILSSKHQQELAQKALGLAKALSLTGIMDVEVILHDDNLYLLEIDARIPSQTPTAVYWSSGVNMVELLGNLFINGRMPSPVESHQKPTASVVFEHIRVAGGSIQSCGEHIMTQAGPLALINDFFGCDEALTDIETHPETWCATLICRGRTPDAAWSKRCAAVKQMGCGLQAQSHGRPQ